MTSTNTTQHISIVIPIFYLPELYLTIKKCLESVAKYYPDWLVITLDDGSPTKNPFPTTIQNETNLGYVKSINKLMEYAFRKADVVIVLNDDLEILPNSLDIFKNLKDMTIASVQDSSGTSDNMFGSNFGMTKKTYELLGGFDEKFKNYFADRDYYNTAIHEGVKVIKDFNYTLPHHESATFNKLDKKKLFNEDEVKL